MESHPQVPDYVKFAPRPALKYFSVAGAAMISTAMCFYLMLFLITNELNPQLEVDPQPFVHPKYNEVEKPDLVAQRKKPQKAVPLQPPPDNSGVNLNLVSRVELQAEKPTFGSIADLIGPEDIQLQLDAPVSDLTPLHMVQPIYPMSAQMREVEGYVVVKFSVEENGRVLNPIVVESEPKVLFDQAALNAVTKFKFQPRMVGGDRVRVDDVQMKFAFNLESLYDIPEEYKR